MVFLCFATKAIAAGLQPANQAAVIQSIQTAPGQPPPDNSGNPATTPRFESVSASATLFNRSLFAERQPISLLRQQTIV
jgi:hypothetical protein